MNSGQLWRKTKNKIEKVFKEETNLSVNSFSRGEIMRGKRGRRR